MALCGSQNCGCAFASSATISVTGSGTAGDPFVFAGGVSTAATIETFTASGTWTKPVGLSYIEVEVQGAGGGSGGCALTPVGDASAGNGGGGGGYCRKVIAAASLASTVTVTVGAGGTAGASGANSGGTGDTSSFGAHCSATGGAGGTGGAALSGSSPFGTPALGGTATGGDVNIPGGASQYHHANAAGSRVIKGPGGASFLGPGVRPGSTVLSSSAGIVGPLYGGGATGPGNIASQAAQAGAVGGAGIVIVREYY